MQTIDHNPIDEALVQELVSYRDVSKARQRNYAELLKMEIKEKEFSRNKDKQTKIQDRLAIGEAVQKEKQQLITQKSKKLQLQHLIQADNLKLMQIHRQIIHPQQTIIPKQHPFVKLVEQQDFRNNQLKEKFRYQNHFNEMQQQIKRSQGELTRRSQRAERAKYEQHVEDDFVKRDNSYKKLRLMHTDRNLENVSRLDLKRMEEQAQQNYLEFLKNQVKEKNNRLIQQKTVNRSVDANRVRNESPELSPSPAFLGVTPYSYDRKRQLEVLDKNFGLIIPKTIENHTFRPREATEDRLIFSSRVNPQDLRIRVNTQQTPNSNIRSQQASPANKQLPNGFKLPSIRQHQRTINTPTHLQRTGRRNSSMAVRTQQPEQQSPIKSPTPTRNYKTIKSYNFINGTVSTHRVPS